MKITIAILLDYSTEQSFSLRPWYALRCDYIEVLRKFGVIPILLPYVEENILDYLNMVDGIIFPGSDSDVDPSYYGEEVDHPEVLVEKFKTAFEVQMMRAAIQKDIPILGICNGMQLMNVVCGGSLIQHIPEEYKDGKIEHKISYTQQEFAHDILIKDGTCLADITKISVAKVNSYHHQAVKELGDNMVISAVAPDGIIEAIEHKYMRFCMGVEWHPEYLSDNGIDVKIFQKFIKECEDYAKENRRQR